MKTSIDPCYGEYSGSITLTFIKFGMQFQCFFIVSCALQLVYVAAVKDQSCHKCCEVLYIGSLYVKF